MRGLPEWESTWPQRRERRPSFFDAYYLHYSALAESLAAARDRYLRPGIEILDVGCGEAPYYPLFADLASDYVGTDIEPGPLVRHVCSVEDLDLPDRSFDLVLCTQVLEHVQNPPLALSEICRVLRPGGYAFVTTHGVWPFHPYPADFNRWTQQGLEALFEGVPDLTLVELVAHRGTASCIALLLNYYVEVAARRARVEPVGAALSAIINCTGLAGDKIRRLGYPNSDTLIHNFLAIGKRKAANGS